MQNLDLDQLESASGGLKLQGSLSLAAAAPVNPVGTTDPNAMYPTTLGQPVFQPVGGDFFPFGGGEFQGQFHGGGDWGGGMHHGGGHHAFHEFTHDATFQAALGQFEAQHPELAGALAPMQQGHGMFHVMHDPAGRAALDQFFHDPTFANALNQFSAVHPDMAGRLSNMVQHMEFRMENGGQFGGPFGGQFGGPFGGQPFGGQPYGGAPQGTFLGQPIILTGGTNGTVINGGTITVGTPFHF
jgi:hypothetical protein